MKGIHHAGVVVSDLDRSIDFYIDVLGLELMTEPSEPSSGARLDHILGVDGVRLRGALLRAGSSAVELHEFQAPEWTGERPVPAHALGAQHIAFWCDDLAAEMAAITTRGGVFATEINAIDTGPFAGLRTAFIRDPDDIRIEFVEVAYWPAAARDAGIDTYWQNRRERMN